MTTLFDASRIDMYDVVEKSDYLPIDKEDKEVPRYKWTNAYKVRYHLNFKTRNAIKCALSKDDYTQIRSFKNVKQM